MAVDCKKLDCCADSLFEYAIEPVTTFCNTQQMATAQCPEGQTGDPVSVTVQAGELCGYASQELADAAALASALSQAEALLDCE